MTEHPKMPQPRRAHVALVGAELEENLALRHIQPRFARARWTQRAASVGVAASLALAVDAAGQGTHTTEMAAEPPSVRPEVKPGADDKSRPPDGEASAILQRFRRSALATLARYVKPPQKLTVELWTDDKGSVVMAEVYKGERKPTAEPAKELDEKDKKRVAELVTQLGAGSFKERENATSELTKLGSAVLPAVKKKLASSDDPEVTERCRRIIGGLDEVLDIPDKPELVNFLKTLSFPFERARGKRFLLPVSEQDFGRSGPRVRDVETHMFEMAPMPPPGPRD